MTTNVSLPIYRDVTCKAGDTFNFNFVLKDKTGYITTPRYLTGYTASGAVSTRPRDGVLVESMVFSSSLGDLILGIISMRIEAEDTAEIDPGTYYYDIYVDGDGDVTTYFEGKFIVEARITP